MVRLLRRALQATSVQPGQVLVACSGGPDSTALMLSLVLLADALPSRPSVVCVDHRLRAAAADEAEQVIEVAGRLGLPAQVLRIDVPTGPSRQAQARGARYAALVAHAQRIGARWIALGHTRDDQAETMLMRWLAGAGPRGLAGMRTVAVPPVLCPSQVRLLRPLLAVSRAQIEAFLRLAAPLISPLPIADPSNQDRRYLRAQLRHEALPLLRRVAPSLDAHLLELSEQLACDAEFLDEQAEQALLRLLRSAQQAPPAVALDADRLGLSVRELATLPPALAARVLRRLLGPSLGARHVAALRSLCADTAGRKWLDLPGCGRIERSRDWLLLPRRSVQCLPPQGGAEPRLLPTQEQPVLDGCEADA